MTVKKTVLTFLLFAIMVLMGVSRLEAGNREQGRQRLEESLRRTAAACYAAEGFYPPDVDYLEQNWGIRYDRERYAVHYEIFADNLMPQITVLEKAYEK